ncbi:MAG: dephospho-CoA kinase [Nitrospirae bacterium]|nr:dephospho-CoA kinase [Nitrospirota bacterium]
MPFIGLTGNFGMGKSTVLRLFKQLGAYTISADETVSGILKRPAIINKLTTALGKEILIKRAGRKSIDKKRAADIIFNNAQKRRLAEEIIHPEVIKKAEEFKAKTLKKNPSAVIIFEVPLLFESGYEKLFEKVIVVYCKRETAISRLVAKGFSKEDAIKRLRAQMPISKKKALADFLINNNLGINSTREKVKAVLSEITKIL